MQKISPTVMNSIGAAALCVLVKFSSATVESVHLAIAGIFSCTVLYTARTVASFSPIPSKQILINTTFWNMLFFVSVGVAAIGITLVFFSGNEFHGRRRIQTTEPVQISFAICIAVLYMMYTIRAHKSLWKQVALLVSSFLDIAYEIYDTFVFLFDAKYFFRERKVQETNKEDAFIIIASCSLVIGTALTLFFVALIRIYIQTNVFDVSGSIILVTTVALFTIGLVYTTAPRYLIRFGVSVCFATVLYTSLVLL